MQTKLTPNRLSNFLRIDVDTERGVVNLNGVVETEAQRARAERLARQVEGVARINNNLWIQSRLPSEKQTNPAHVRDTKTGQPEQNGGVRAAERPDVTDPGGLYPPGRCGDCREGWDGMEVSIHADSTTIKTTSIKPGDRVEVKIDKNNHARCRCSKLHEWRSSTDIIMTCKVNGQSYAG